MHQRAGSRIQNTQNGQRYRQKVDTHGQADAELDGFDGGIGQALQIGQFGNIVTHQDHIGSFHSDIAAETSHRYTYIGNFKCRSIIYAITDHADTVSFLLNCCNTIYLFFRQELCFQLIDTNLAGKVVGGFLIVTGKQNNICVHAV